MLTNTLSSWMTSQMKNETSVSKEKFGQVSNTKNEEEPRDIEEFLRKIDSLFEDVAEVTIEEKCNSLAIVVYTRPFQVASPTQTVADDAGAKPGTRKQFEGRAKPKEEKKEALQGEK
ncbi:hypothetical protein PVK06_039971 [Gossypium arboreum]|uniref:Uncharacterized protein n=1 Tax=Gossypium arboreum TaxID=29729 RepID=A0ABR0N4B0_GOSAR|nr:hypothetical protein PVK06_039971 [Gossypium arboreum]